MNMGCNAKLKPNKTRHEHTRSEGWMELLHDSTRPEADGDGDLELLAAEMFVIEACALIDRLDGAELRALAHELHAALLATPVDQTIHGKWPWLPNTTEAVTDTTRSVVAN